MDYAIGTRIGRRVVVGRDGTTHTLRCDCGATSDVFGSFWSRAKGYCYRGACHPFGDDVDGIVVGSRLGRLTATEDHGVSAPGYRMLTWRCDCGNTVVWSDMRAARLRECCVGGCRPRKIPRRVPRAFAHVPRETKRAAVVAVTRALHLGELLRPDACSRCGRTPHGRTKKINGHHADYSKPLEVVWLCFHCHRDEHTRLNRAAREAARKAA